MSPRVPVQPGDVSVGQDKASNQDGGDSVRAAYYENQNQLRRRAAGEAFDSDGPESFLRVVERVWARG